MCAKSPTGLSTPWQKKIYDEQGFRDAWKESWSTSTRFFYARIVHQTLAGAYKYLLKPDQVYYVGQYPTAYILSVDEEPEPEEIEQWRKFLWNQSVVPILIVKIAKRKICVYTANEYEGGFAKALSDTADALDRLETEIESGAFFGKWTKHFDRNRAVDKHLLSNLRYATFELCKTRLSKTEKDFVDKIELQGSKAKNTDREKTDALLKAHQESVQLFLTRILFICYLIDRGMLKGEHFQHYSDSALINIAPTDSQRPHRLIDVLKECRTAKERRSVIEQVFAVTKERFNGSLFNGSGVKDSDESKFNDDFLRTLTRLLGGDELKTRQRTFGFMSYDFNIIPIETISAIYESFLGAQGIQRTSGAYYTPPHLAELVVDIALENFSDQKIYEKNVLDPSCGSGIFLVSLFNRMADQLRYEEDYEAKSHDPNWCRKVLDLLTKIYGIDSNSTACHIACFSLYLAALEQLKPTDLDELENGVLPHLLSDPEKGHNDGSNIVKANFFDPELPIDGQKFDLIIGNPPWVSGRHQKDTTFLNWQENNDRLNPCPEKEIAYGFLWKTKPLLAEKGTACLLLPASILWSNHTNKFLKKWLKQTTVERVVNFSDLRRLLFENAVHPCVAMRFTEGYSVKASHVICYESPKTDSRSQIGGPIYVREEDRTRLFQENAIAGAKVDRSAMIWKVPFWGKGRDQQLIERLCVFPKLGDLFPKTKNGQHQEWVSGDGIKGMACANPKKGSWDTDTLFLDHTEFDRQGLLIDPTVLKTTGKWNIPLEVERPRIPQLFSGARVLVSQGVKINVAYCDFDLVFKDSITAFCGPLRSASLLKFLCVILNSSLARYYLFHTATCWGSERDRVMLVEYRSIPFFLPENAPNPEIAQKCISEIVKRLKNHESKTNKTRELQRGDFTGFNPIANPNTVRAECEALVRRYYGINQFEEHLIDDTIQYIIPSTTPTSPTSEIPTLNRVKEEQCVAYANELLDMFRAFAWKEEGYPYSARVYAPGTNDQYGVIQIDRSYDKEKKVTTINKTKDLQTAIKRISEHLGQHETERIIHCLNLKVFIGNSLYILKPAQLRFWTRIAAQNDADEIATAIIKQTGGLK